jgi:hypothetical protein
MPIITALFTAAALFILARRDDPRTRRLVLGVLVADLGVFAQLCYGPFLCPPAVDLRRGSPLEGLLEAAGGPTASRFLSLTSEERPEDFALNEPNSSVLRGTASAGGNSSFVLGRYGAMLGWADAPGGVDLAGAGRAFDLLGVKRLIVADQLLFPRPRVSVRGIGLADRDLGIKLALRRGNALDVELPGLRCSAIALEATSVSGALPPSVPLLRASVVARDGRRMEAVLRAARETIPWAGDPPGQADDAGAYRMAWDLGRGIDLVRVRLEVLGRLDALRIDRLLLHDAGTRHTLAMAADGREALARLLPVPQRIEVEFPSSMGTALDVVSAISGPTTLSEGEAMARVSVQTADGAVIERILRAGEHTSEWAWERPDVRPYVQHRMAPLAETYPAPGGFPGHRYLGHLDLGGRRRVERLVIEHVGPDSSLFVDRVDLVDEDVRRTTRLPIEAIELQPASTAPPGPRELVLPVPPVPCTGLAIVTALHDSTAMHQGQAVGRVSVRTEDGPEIVALLRAGEDTSEWAWDRPDVRPRVRHARATVAESVPVPGEAYEGHRYSAHVALDARRRVVELKVEALAPVASLEVGRVVFEDGGASWSLPAPGIPAVLTPEETRARVELEMPPAAATDVAIASRLSRSLEVGQGEVVAMLRAFTTDGEVVEKALRAGEDTSEWRAALPEVKDRLRHREAPTAFAAAAGMEPGTWYLTRVPLGGRRRLRSLAIDAVDPAAVLSVARVSLHDAVTGTSTPVSRMGSILADRPGWRPLCATAATTIYENAAALPRAWLVRRVAPLSDPDALAAVRSGRLPDGSAFEPRRVAIIEGGPETDYGPLDPEARVELSRRSPDTLGATTRSRTPAFLVLAEAAYPGWRATIDGKPAAIVRADHVLRGLSLPAGEHRVELEYRPRSFQVGLAVSAAALVALALAGRAAPRRAWPPLAAVALLPGVWLAVAVARLPVSSAGETRNESRTAPATVGLLDLATIPDGAAVLGPGWWPAEAWAMGEPGRWTGGEAVLHLERTRHETGLAVDMTLDHPSGQTSVRIEAGGRVVRRVQAPNGRRRDVVDVGWIPGSALDVRIVAESPFASVWRPVGRSQGVFVHSVQLLEEPLRSQVDLFAPVESVPALGPGWWDAERWAGGPGGRWTSGEAVLRLERGGHEDGLVVDLSLDHPDGMTSGRIEVDGRPAQVIRAPNGRHTFSIPIGGRGGRIVTVRLVADRPFVPRAYDPSSGDGRALGLFVHSARLVPFSRCP